MERSAESVVEPPGLTTEAEERFELLRSRVGLYLGPLLGLLVWFLGDDDPKRRLAGLIVFSSIWWLCEPVPLAVTALFSVALSVLLGIATPKEAFAAFGNPLLFLFVGSFFLAEAMRLHRLGERMARAVARLAKGQLGALIALSSSAFTLSLWISNTAATAVLLPIALSVARSVDDKRFRAAMVLAISYGASVGGVGTPVGTPPNLIGIGALKEQAGIEVGFLTWMSIGLPLGLAMLALLVALLAVRFRLKFSSPVEVPGEGPGRWSRGELAVAAVFLLAVFLWVAPGFALLFAEKFPALTPAAAWMKAHLTEEVVALCSSGLLFLWPIGEEGKRTRRVLSWEEASRIDWGTVLLFGGGILLGDLAGKTGLAKEGGEALIALTGAESLWAITALVTAASLVLSEATSNTATATLMLPLTLSLAAAAGVPPLPPALGATLGASFGFMLPISTAPNAMAYGTGQVTIRQMASTGVIFDLLGFVVIVLGLRLLCPALGLV